MITIENHIGKITISDRYLKDLIWNTVTSCFGVSDMKDTSLLGDICSFFKNEYGSGNAVSIKAKNNRLIIGLHISVVYGTNISAVVSSLKHKIRYAVKEATGIDASSVNISVDSITE